MTYSEIHIWGDSLARGIVYQEEKRRYAISPVRYTTLLQSAFGIPVHNHSVMGATTLDGLKSFENSPSAPGALCAIAYGGNDCDLDWAYVAQHPQEPVAAKVPLPLYRAKLKEFVKGARERGMLPLLVTPIPLHAERYFRWVTREVDAGAVLRALRDIQSIYRWQERYALALRNVALETGSKLFDLRDAFLAQARYETLMCLDGIHPNDAGYGLMARAMLKAALADPHMPRAQAPEGTPVCSHA